MRTYKFRAWNGTKMLLSENAEFYLIPNNKVQVPSPTGHEFYDKDYPIMQFTGLHDINGVEVFEGDVVKWGHVEGSEETPHRVAIVEIDPCIQFNCQITNYVFEYGDFAYQQTDKYLEVIGNIYEHPHLIESEK